MNRPPSSTGEENDELEAALGLSQDSYTYQRLLHATPEHLHLTSRRCFIGPIPEGWLKSHRKDWYKQQLHIHYSSHAATFRAQGPISKQRALTGLDGPSTSASYGLTFRAVDGGWEEDDEEEGEEETGRDGASQDAQSASSSRRKSSMKNPFPPAADDTQGDMSMLEPVSTTDPSYVPVKQHRRSSLRSNLSPTSSRSEHATDNIGISVTIHDAPAVDGAVDDTPPVEIPQTENRLGPPSRLHRNRSEASHASSRPRTEDESTASFVTAEESLDSRKARSRYSESQSSLQTITQVPPEPTAGTAADADDHRLSVLQEQSSAEGMKSDPTTPMAHGGKVFQSPILDDNANAGRAYSSTSSLLPRDGPDVSRPGTSLDRKGDSPQKSQGPADGNITVDTTSRASQLNTQRARHFSTIGSPGAGLVRFNLPDDAPQEREVQMRLAQMRKRDTFKRMMRGSVRDGHIVKAENMLVRVESTAHALPEDFNENDSQGIESRVVSKWKEFMVGCRERDDHDAPLVLQFYKTRVIAAVDQDHSSKRCAYTVPLHSKKVKANLFSALDKTIVLWTSTEKGRVIYIMRARSSASSMEWYTFIRGVLGWSRPSAITVNVPELNMNLQLQNPFAILETSDNIRKAAEGDQEALSMTMREEQAVSSKIISRCIHVLSENPEWKDIVRTWTSHDRVGLAWKRYDRIEWVHGANEKKMYGTMGMEKSHELELRVKKHYPTVTRIGKDKEATVEPPPVEGFLVRLTSQRGLDRKYGKLFYKRLYFATHNQYLIFNRPALAVPPSPPKMPMLDEGNVPSAHRIAEQTPVIYAVTPFKLEGRDIEWLQLDTPPAQRYKADHDAFTEQERKINLIHRCDGLIDLSNAARVRDVYHGAIATDHVVEEGSDVSFHEEVPDTREDDGTTRTFDSDRTFEIVMRNGLVVRLQAFNRETKREWKTRLRDLIKYWSARVRDDIGLFKEIRRQNVAVMKVDEESEALVGQLARKWEVKKTVASPELHNMCGVSCCRSIHLSGTLFRKPRYHGNFQRNLVILSHGQLIYFQDALRRHDGSLVKHTHHDRVGSLDLKECYIYSGLITASDLLYTSGAFDPAHPGHHALPRMYREDQWQSTDEDTMTCFVIWHGKKRAWFKTMEDERDGKSGKQKLKMVGSLGKAGKSVVFKARSRAERDRWVLAIAMEIERLSQGESHVRIVEKK